MKSHQLNDLVEKLFYLSYISKYHHMIVKQQQCNLNFFQVSFSTALTSLTTTLFQVDSTLRGSNFTHVSSAVHIYDFHIFIFNAVDCYTCISQFFMVLRNGNNFSRKIIINCTT